MHKDLRDLIKSYIPPTTAKVVDDTVEWLKRESIFSVTGHVMRIYYGVNGKLEDYQHVLDFKRICGNVLIGINVFIAWRYAYIIDNFLTLDVVDPRNWLLRIIEKAKIKNSRSHCRLMRTIINSFLDDIKSYINFTYL